jgi:hypothetical protein
MAPMKKLPVRHGELECRHEDEDAIGPRYLKRKAVTNSAKLICVDVAQPSAVQLLRKARPVARIFFEKLSAEPGGIASLTSSATIICETILCRVAVHRRAAPRHVWITFGHSRANQGQFLKPDSQLANFCTAKRPCFSLL